ncbi:MAG: PucR family transcriptional regulator, partial [Umezawaea sp.]
MTPRPHAGLGRVLDDLGATLLELVLGHPDRSRAIGGIAIHDPLDDAPPPPQALVLGVGLGDPAAIAGLLHSLGQQSAVGLVVRAPVPVSEELTAAVEHTGVALIGLTRGASWAQLAAMLRSLLAEDDIGGLGPETLGGMPSGDLFALSNAVAALLDAPVTIEDRGSRVLAFSGRQDEADTSRVETILGRQVPERYSRVLAERGVFRVLYRTDQPVYIEPVTQSSLPRVAVAVRAGDEVLGSIWVAVREPLSPDRTRALVDAARLVALHMLRIRAGADVERRLRTDLLSTALEGGPGARDALDRLGLAGRPVVVLAMATTDPEDATATEAALATERQRLGDALTMHLSALHPRCATALIGDITYGLVPSTHDGEQRALTIASDFLDRVGDRTRAVIAISPVAADTSELPTARATADRALRVLRAGSTRRTARLADVHVEALVLELRDLAAAQGDRPTGAIAKLIAYDARHTARLVETLRAWLDAFGDVIAAS